MKRKNYWFLFAILLLALTSLSQGQNLNSNSGSSEERKTMSWNPKPSSPQDTDDQPIQVMTHLNESDYKELLNINDAFVNETGIQVELHNIPDVDAYRQLIALLEVGEGPDVMLVNSPWIHSLASSGYILPAESYLSSTNGSDIISPVLQMLEWNGYQWGVPLDMDPYVLAWQMQALQSLGVGNIPGTAKDWRDLLAKLEIRKGKPIALPSGDVYAFAALMGVVGGTNPADPSVEELDSVGKIRPWIQFIENDRMQVARTSLNEGGLLLMTVPFSATFREKNKLEFQVPDQLYAINPFLLRGRSFAVASQTKYPEKVAEWIAYMTSDKSQRIWYDSTGNLPVLKQMYEEDQFRMTKPPVTLGQLLNPIEGGHAESTLQSEWENFAKEAKLFLSGKSTEQQYREALDGHPKEKKPE
ncbi:ABC transporter substrate-binding protein [Paenibacillus sp.]|uniref:ABC transporter substrate-binding protein n=1 Tax=Paenibacillus sp. TaxID=58172 RepID=UPI00281DDB1B|nr:ABC transporter substrate-binding protein [Paenibacillus sp.]MDR0268951.1 ABC transporter substrate-binding protein [Paenibacillus sp.]